ncbi:Cationic amino acid transporter 2 [Nymphon striatum]|nr:Cationic amino acid transporter 2 [Nymphon striatum]
MQKTIQLFLARLSQRKQLHDLTESGKLARCLSVFDLTALGVGSTLGLGMYILAGQIAATKTGPSVILSFLIAVIASLLSGLCYAEFGARVPKAGSAYIYSYVSVGELMAFIIGWNMILEYVIGAASVARGYSGYISAMFDDKIIQSFNRTMHINIPHLSPYPDFLAFGITFLVSLLLAFGVKTSTRFNNVFTSINLMVATFVIIGGAFKADVKNWQIQKDEIPEKFQKVAGNGGFAPFGFAGVISGAASCFYAFVGFDIIATTGEEAKNPQRSTPIAIMVSLLISFVAYFGVSMIQTLMVPYYMQDNEHPLSFVFDYVHWPAAKWIVSVGALTGLSSSKLVHVEWYLVESVFYSSMRYILFGSIFPLPRVVYSMASDGLIFQWLGRIHDRFQTPFIATIIGGLFGGLMAMFFDVEALTSMMSIGTLLAYTLVAVSVLILRYCTEFNGSSYMRLQNVLYKFDNFEKYMEIDQDSCEGDFSSFTRSDYMSQLVNYGKLQSPTTLSSKLSKLLILCISLRKGFIVEMALSYLLISAPTAFSQGLPQFNGWSSEGEIVPFVPLLPILSIIINMYLMAALDSQTWVRFAVWMLLGFMIYFGYGIKHSVEGKRYVEEYLISEDEAEIQTDIIKFKNRTYTDCPKE